MRLFGREPAHIDGVPRWLQNWFRSFLHPPWYKSRVTGQENESFSFQWQLKRENWGICSSLDPKEGRWLACQERCIGESKSWEDIFNTWFNLGLWSQQYGRQPEHCIWTHWVGDLGTIHCVLPQNMEWKDWELDHWLRKMALDWCQRNVLKWSETALSDKPFH